MKLTELIARAPWREAVTYRDSWPHEYVLSEKDRAARTAERHLRPLPGRGGCDLPLLPCDQQVSLHR